MLTLYLGLLVLYVALAVLYVVTPPKPVTLHPWPLIPTPQPLPHSMRCEGDADCPPQHVCLSHTCVPKLLRGGKCDSETGYWMSHEIHHTPFAVCACRDTRLFDQKFFGGNCSVSVACGVHGRLDPVRKVCLCDPGYRPKGWTCEKSPVFEQMVACGPDELQVTDPMPDFHVDYLKHLRPAKCVKRPCSFDALSGRPLKHGRYERDWGCVCDPSQGLFGVQLNLSGERYLSAPGFDACASLFLRDPPHPIPVKVVTYFYLMDRPPVSLILFENVTETVPLLRGRRHWMIHQPSWRYDFAQHFFKNHPTFRARSRRIIQLGIFGMTRVEDKHWDQFEAPYCQNMHNRWLWRPLEKDSAYNLLYDNPVCVVFRNDTVARDEFKDRMVVNPFHVTLADHDQLERFNAFVLEYDPQMGRWTLDLDYPHKMNAYRQSVTNAPHYTV